MEYTMKFNKELSKYRLKKVHILTRMGETKHLYVTSNINFHFKKFIDL